jgi:predicted AAA+ superfamily ATPase
MVVRLAAPGIAEAVALRPAVLLLGARQVGKTWLSKDLEHHYVTFDDITLLLQAQEDPVRFVENLPQPTCIDEIQRVPSLFLPIKQIIDRSDQRPNQFLLTGSANVFHLPQMADSLAGRLRLMRLFPFAQIELFPREYRSVFDLFWNRQWPEPRSVAQDLIETLTRGGYPIAVLLQSSRERCQWFSDLIDTVASKDIRDLAQIVDGYRAIKLLNLMAARVGQLVNLSEISRSLREPLSTVQRDWATLQAIYLLEELPAWSRNLSKRLLKSPKAYLNDTGLACFCLGADQDRLMQDRRLMGHLLENYVYNELSKQLSWSQQDAKMFHFRSQSGEEVDFVVERRSGECCAIEVKAASTLSTEDLKGIRYLEKELGDAFIQGVIFYTGTEIKHMGGRVVALPLSVL